MTRQQKWAHAALAKVASHKGKTDAEKKEESKYRTLCLKMPALLKQSGVVQALAFIRSRDKDHGKKFCDELAEAYGISATDSKKSAGETLQDRAQKEELPQYLVLSRDLIEVSVWFRRFAQSELKAEDDDEST